MSPEDRHARGLVPMLSVADNLSLSALSQFAAAGFVKRRAETAAVADFLKTLLIRAQSRGAGGVRAFRRQPAEGRPRPLADAASRSILILDEPTRGIDVVAKAEVHGTIDRLAHEGLAVLLISSELPEILGMSDRILVMRDGAARRRSGRAGRQRRAPRRLAAGARHDE